MNPSNSPAQPTRGSIPLRRLPALALLCSLLMAPVAMAEPEPAAAPAGSAASAAPAAAPATPAPAVAAPATPATDNAAALPAAEAKKEDKSSVKHDLSPWGMFQNADAVVKSVMIGLLLASVATWTIWLAKGLELRGARRRLYGELADLKGARTLEQASQLAHAKHSFSASLIEDAQDELRMSEGIQLKDGIKERVSFRLERLVAASGRKMGQGTGVLATVGSVSPFVGLFGTVWGIMNSFIGIAESQTTNLAVVAPGIAEALLATALGLVAAIPAVVVYNVFARSIAAYKAQVADISAQILLLVSRDLDRPAAARQEPRKAAVE